MFIRAQRLDWEVSYCVLRLEFNTAMKKMEVEVSDTDLSELADGQYRASITVSCEPQFTSVPAQSPLAAKG